MGILVTFDDGHAEERPDDCQVRTLIGLSTVARARGFAGASVERDSTWQSARVETVDEQIERLTWERDAALARLEEAGLR